MPPEKIARSDVDSGSERDLEKGPAPSTVLGHPRPDVAEAVTAGVEVDIEKNLPLEETSGPDAIPDAIGSQAKGDGAANANPQDDAPYSIWTYREKLAMVLLVSFMALISPMSGQIYLPALPLLARDLDVSASLINLTITTYVVRANSFPARVARNASDLFHRSSKASHHHSSAISQTAMVDGRPT